MDGRDKLKHLDQNIRDIEKELKDRETTGERKSMAESHGDFIKQFVDDGKGKVVWIPTDENLADIMTKPLPQKAHAYLRNKITNIEFKPEKCEELRDYKMICIYKYIYVCIY